MRLVVLLWFALTMVAQALPVNGQTVAWRAADGGIAQPLTAQLGDAERGRALVANRQTSLCLLCHSGPFEQPGFQGNLAPPLDGAGARLSAAQLRLRIVDSAQLNPSSIMPAFHATLGLQQVGGKWQGQPVLTAQQVEDVVAFLVTLK